MNTNHTFKPGDAIIVDGAWTGRVATSHHNGQLLEVIDQDGFDHTVAASRAVARLHRAFGIAAAAPIIEAIEAR